MRGQLTTYRDLIEYGLDYLGVDSSAEGLRAVRNAVQTAYREYTNSHNWNYFYQRGRFNTVGQYVTGTIQYTHTGGAVERMVTLTGGTWPSWAQFGTLVVGVVKYSVSALVNSTTLQLSENSNPGADLAAGTSYILYQDIYPLPADFRRGDEFILVGQAWRLSQVHPRDWLSMQRLSQGPATPRSYSIAGDPRYFGELACLFFPAPDQQYTVDFLYVRRPRPLTTELYSTGSVSIQAGSYGVTGAGTNWTQQHVGCAVRVSSDGVNLPTRIAGSNPALDERIILAVNTSTSATVDNPWAETLSSVKHTLSDPADLEEGAMMTGLLREVEKQLRIVRRMKTLPDEKAEYEAAMFRAWEADARYLQTRSAGESQPYRPRLAYMPRGPDIS